MSKIRHHGLCAALLLLLCAPFRADANDSAVRGVGGTASPLKGEHPTIRMVRETVQLDLYPDYYDTVADFTFTNTGRATTVQMGFPESGGGDVPVAELQKRKTGGFLSFTTTVDGSPIQAKRTPGKKDDEESYDAYWVKQVPFGARQTRRVRVKYRSPYGETSVLGMRRWASYNFTGGNWHGSVAESVLTVRMHEPGTFITSPSFELKTGKTYKSLPTGWMKPTGATFTHTWRNWEAEGNFLLTWGKTAPDWLAAPNEIITGMGDNMKTAQITTVTVPGKVSDDLLGYDYPPPAMLADKIIWLNLAQAPWSLGDMLKSRNLSAEKAYDSATKQTTLTIGDKVFKFTPGKASMTVNGVEEPLPATPKRGRGRYHNQLLMYVPVLPIISHLHSEVTLNPATHTIMFGPAKTTSAAMR